MNKVNKVKNWVKPTMQVVLPIALCLVAMDSFAATKLDGASAEAVATVKSWIENITALIAAGGVGTGMYHGLIKGDLKLGATGGAIALIGGVSNALVVPAFTLLL